MIKKILFISFLFLLSAFSIFLFLPYSKNQQSQLFVINQGDNIVQIASRLSQNHLIRNKYAFIFYSFVTGQSKSIHAGGFQLSASDSLDNILAKLTTGGSYDYWLKIIPGQRATEFASENLLNLAAENEGYLFPDSYLIPDYFESEEIISLIRKNFDQKISTLQIDDSNLSDTVILASLLEREAKTKSDRQMVAGIIRNRLKIGMPLQIDASVQYGRDSLNPPTKYWLPATKSDLSIDSPFNTYLYKGLPPAPICNPSLDSLFAAKNPIDSDYLFYISDNDGIMHYARTLSEHNQNIAKYLK